MTCLYFNCGERQRERERQTDRQTETDRDRQTDRQKRMEGVWKEVNNSQIQYREKFIRENIHNHIKRDYSKNALNVLSFVQFEYFMR